MDVVAADLAGAVAVATAEEAAAAMESLEAVTEAAIEVEAEDTRLIKEMCGSWTVQEVVAEQKRRTVYIVLMKGEGSEVAISDFKGV